MKKRKTDHPLFRTWTMMNQVLYNKNCPDYHRYGHDLTSDWDNFWDFADYVDKTLGDKPGAEYKLNRKDQTQGWIAGNLQWAKPKEIVNNSKWSIKTPVSKNSSKITNAVAISEQLGVSRTTIRHRIKQGWTAKEIEKYYTTNEKYISTYRRSV
jgi:hypothetical protein